MKTKILSILFLFLTTIAIGQNNSSIDYVLGVDYSYRTLGTDSDDDFMPTIISLRNASEKAKIGFRLGVNYNKQLSRNFWLKTGVRIAKTGYKNLQEVNLRYGNQHNGLGGFNGSIDLSTIEINYNYWFIEIPIAGRMEFGKGKLRPYVELGIAPTIYVTTEFSSKVGDEDKQTELRREEFNSVHLVGLASFGFNYQLNKKLQLFGQPTFRYHLTKLVDAPIKEKLFTVGLEMGIRTNFDH